MVKAQMNTDILLINPRSQAKGINESTTEVPLGILYIASFLEKNGFSSKIIDANALCLDDAEVVKNTVGASPLLIGISSTAFNYQTALNYARQIKKNIPDVMIILGGPHPTAIPQLCLETPEIDAVVCGEGEEITYRIMNNLKNSYHPFKDVFGVVYKDNGQIVCNPPDSRIIDIDKLPFPAYHLLPPLKYYRGYARKWPFIGIITSRGCPYQCTFCDKNVFGNKIRFRHSENVISEIEFLVKDKGIRQIDILDDNFTLDRDRCVEICNLLIKKYLNLSINLQSGVRADKVDRDLIYLLRKSGVFKIAFGVESGDEKILKAVKKDINLEAILNASKWARQVGMVVIGYFMVCLPYDTPKTLQKTIDFAKKMNPHIANFMLTIPFFGTTLYNFIEKNGKFLIDTKNGILSGFYGGKAFFELGNLKRDEIEFFYKKAYRDFYFRIDKIIDILGTLRSWQELRWWLASSYSVLINNI